MRPSHDREPSRSDPLAALPRTAPTLALAAALLGLVSCSGTGSKDEPAGRMVAPEEVPERYRQVAEAWKQDGDEWKAYREEALTDPQLADFLVYNLIDVMVDAYSSSQISRTGEMPGPFERAQRDLIHLRWYSKRVLVELLVVGDGVVAFLAGDTLERMQDPSVALPVAERLQEDDPEARRRTAELLAKLPYSPADEAQIMLLLQRSLAEDSEWSVRAQAAEAVGERGARARDRESARRALSLALSDEDPAVVVAACEGLTRLGDPRAVPALIQLLERLSLDGTRLDTLQAVQSSLLALTGERERKGPDGWRTWYREHIVEGRKSP